jgi:hypothetical protein
VIAEQQGIDVLIVGGGVAGQRLGANKWFDPEVVGPDAAHQMRGHIVDPNLPLRAFDDLGHMQAALDDGRLTVATHIPGDRAFDVAYIASPTGTHVESLERVANLPYQPEWTILEKPAASGIHEEEWLSTLLEGPLDPQQIYVHEPYLLLEGLKQMCGIITEQSKARNYPLDIHVWSAKDRTADVAAGRTGNGPELGAFGVEFPHTHAAASLLAGVELGVKQLNARRNVYYRSVDNNPLSEGTYTEFVYNGAVIRVAQGLGPFMMTSRGEILADPTPGITRAAEVAFKDGQRVHLDMQPAVDRHALTTEHPYRHTVLTSYNAVGKPADRQYLPDYPIKTLINNVLGKLQDPDAPSLEGIGVVSSLERCVAIRKIYERAHIESGVIPRIIVSGQER